MIIKPTVGRIVHFYKKGSEEPLAAIITSINKYADVSLFVFEGASYFNEENIYMEPNINYAIEDLHIRHDKFAVWPPKV